MKRTLQIYEQPFSVNSLYYARQKVKTTEARQWSAKIMYQLSNEENLLKLKDLREYFDPSKHYYSISLNFYYPKSKLFTKKGQLSAKAHDLSNIEKPIIDLIFLPVYFDKEVPLGCENLNIDDKYILKLKSEKKICTDDEYHISAIIEIRDLDQV